jgi:hypothetical protein
VERDQPDQSKVTLEPRDVRRAIGHNCGSEGVISLNSQGEPSYLPGLPTGGNAAQF